MMFYILNQINCCFGCKKNVNCIYIYVRGSIPDFMRSSLFIVMQLQLKDTLKL